MLTANALRTQIPLTVDSSGPQSGLSALFAAAVISQTFREMLLKQPERALSEGYLGKRFALSPEHAALIISINAKSLPDLAQQVVQSLGR